MAVGGLLQKARGSHSYLKNYKIRQRVTDVENKILVTGVREEGLNWKIGFDTYTLLYIK